MIKQNVVAPEEVVVAAAAATPSFAENDCAAKKKTAAQLEIPANPGRISPWIEFMRAASPTRTPGPVAIPSDNDEQQSDRMKKHPSALHMFHSITAASKGKQIVMFLDYDGTLSPIVADPDRAFMSDRMRSTVGDLARYFPTAIVSGRARAKVHNFVRLPQLYYAGSHGMDIKGPTKRSKHREADLQDKTILFQPAIEFLPMIDEVCKALIEKTKSTPGSKVENNKFCASIHFRRVDEKRWCTLAEHVKFVLQDYPKLRLTQGRKVLEIRPDIKWDKGRALEFLLEALGFGDCSDVLPIYIGDDRTDEDAFKVLRDRGQGLGILVSRIAKETSASYSLQEPSEVMEFLSRLVEWERLSLKTRQKLQI